METIPPVLIGVAAATAIAVVGRRIVRARLARSPDPGAASAARRAATEVTLVVLGALLMALSIVVGLWLLRVEDPPRGELFPAGAGIVADVPARPGRGFVAGLAVRFTDCDEPVDATLVYAGTAEFFEDNHGALTGATGVTVAVPGTGDVSDVTLSAGTGYYDAIAPNELAADGDGGDATVWAETPRERLAVTGVHGGVRGWGDHLASLVVRFRADWLERRGLGSCYLRLPPLVGTATVIGAQDAMGRGVRSPEEIPTAVYTNSTDRTLFVPYRRSLAIGSAISVVDVGGHEIIEADQEPNALAGTTPALACRAVTPSTGAFGARDADLVAPPGSEAYAVRGASFGRLTRPDCGGVVTIAEAGSGGRRDLVLLLVGAAFSLGAALVLEVLLEIQRRRLARPRT